MSKARQTNTKYIFLKTVGFTWKMIVINDIGHSELSFPQNEVSIHEISSRSKRLASNFGNINYLENKPNQASLRFSIFVPMNFHEESACPKNG